MSAPETLPNWLKWMRMNFPNLRGIWSVNRVSKYIRRTILDGESETWMSCRSSQSWHSQKPPELDSFAQSDPQETPGGRTSSERELSEETNLSLVPRLVWARCYFSKVADHLIRSLSNLLTMGFVFFLHTSSKYILLVVTQSGFESFNVFDISNLFGVFSLASSWLPSHKNWLVLSWEKLP